MVFVSALIIIFTFEFQSDCSANTFHVSAFCALLVLVYVKLLNYEILSNIWFDISNSVLYNL